MARVLIVAGTSQRNDSEVLLSERVAPELLQDEHYSEQLIERLRWAVEDAARVESHAVSADPRG